jgi:tetratricopeptide (TPR) repeat protein
MEKENQKTDISALSLSWQEKIKDIRRQARDSYEYSDESVADDSELFAGAVNENLSAEQIFAGDPDFYKFMEDVPAAESKVSPESNFAAKLPNDSSRLLSVQKILIASIAAVFLMVLYLVLKSPVSPALPAVEVAEVVPQPQETPAPIVAVAKVEKPQEISKPEPAVVVAKVDEPQEIATPVQETPIVPAEPVKLVSLKEAGALYLKGDYEQAMAAYENLHKSLVESSDNAMVRDYLQLQIGLCLKQKADYRQAGPVFRSIARSASPLIAVVANYNICLLESVNGEYLDARSSAYKALALVDAIELDSNLIMSMKRDCQFLAARALTQKILALYDADKDLPRNLWGSYSTINEFLISLDEPQLRTLLSSGSKMIGQSVLGPDIQQVSQQGQLSTYRVVCNGMSIDELMERFAAVSSSNLEWKLNYQDATFLKRPVYLYMPSATLPEFITAAAGAAGMLARMDANAITVSYPGRYDNYLEHVTVCGDEALSLWEKFMITFNQDKYIPNAHFAIALLRTCRSQVAESIAEYKLVANKFSLSSLAPFALYNIGKLKISISDYAGASQELNQLVEQFPDAEIVESAYLCLGDSSAKTGRYADAAKIYGKVYNITYSPQLQLASAFGAGKCFYQTDDYSSAQKWLIRYLSHAKTEKNKDFYSAYFLLGKTELELKNSEAACEALQRALNKDLPNLQYIEASSILINESLAKERFVDAMNVLEAELPHQFSQDEALELLLLKSSIFRAMGLPDKAIAVLGGKAENTTSVNLKTKTGFEISKCYIKKGELNIASDILTETLTSAEAGPLSNEIALTLADVCLKSGLPDQAISTCSNLLESELTEQIKQQALKILAQAYNQQENYESAAMALLGQWK